MDILIFLHRRLQRAVDVLHARSLAQRVFRTLMTLRYRGLHVVTARQNDRAWQLDPEVALRGEFAEFDTVLWLRSVVTEGMTTIDVGANVGQMTLEMAELVGPSGRVIAIEPAPGNVQILRRHVDANGYSERVDIVAAACGDKPDDTMDLVIYGTSPTSVGSGHQFAAVNPDAGTVGLPKHTISVPVVSIDSMCASRNLTPAVIKIDVEGAELYVLRGALQVLKARQPAVRVAFHPFAFADQRAAASEILSIMENAGLRMNPYLDPSDWRLAEYVFSAS